MKKASTTIVMMMMKLKERIFCQCFYSIEPATSKAKGWEQWQEWIEITKVMPKLLTDSPTRDKRCYLNCPNRHLALHFPKHYFCNRQECQIYDTHCKVQTDLSGIFSIQMLVVSTCCKIFFGCCKMLFFF